jgi:hypothetical protein
VAATIKDDDIAAANAHGGPNTQSLVSELSEIGESIDEDRRVEIKNKLTSIDDVESRLAEEAASVLPPRQDQGGGRIF